MVGHEHIGIYCTTSLPRIRLQLVQIEPVVIVGVKARLPVVSPLNQMHRDTGQHHSGSPWHGRSSSCLY